MIDYTLSELTNIASNLQRCLEHPQEPLSAIPKPTSLDMHQRALINGAIADINRQINIKIAEKKQKYYPVEIADEVDVIEADQFLKTHLWVRTVILAAE